MSLSSVVWGLSALVLAACAAKVHAKQVELGKHLTINKTTYQYLAGAQQNLDLYIPANASDANPVPLFVFIHGGAWRSGTKAEYEQFGRNVAQAGNMAVAVIEYRLSIPRYGDAPVQYPLFVEDGAAAYTFLLDLVRSKQVPIDENKLFVGGHSAGGHMTGCLALNDQFLGDLKSTVAGWISIEGIHGVSLTVQNFPEYKEWFIADAFGEDESKWDAMSPNFFNDRAFSPFYILFSLEDELLDTSQATSLEDHLKRLSMDVSLTYEVGGCHFCVLDDARMHQLIAEICNDNPRASE